MWGPLQLVPVVRRTGINDFPLLPAQSTWLTCVNRSWSVSHSKYLASHSQRTNSVFSATSRGVVTTYYVPHVYSPIILRSGNILPLSSNIVLNAWPQAFVLSCSRRYNGRITLRTLRSSLRMQHFALLPPSLFCHVRSEATDPVLSLESMSCE